MFDINNIKYVNHSEIMSEDIREEYIEEFCNQIEENGYDLDSVLQLDFAFINIEEYCNIAETVLNDLDISDSDMEDSLERLSKLKELFVQDIMVQLDN